MKLVVVTFENDTEADKFVEIVNKEYVYGQYDDQALNLSMEVLAVATVTEAIEKHARARLLAEMSAKGISFSVPYKEDAADGW